MARFDEVHSEIPFDLVEGQIYHIALQEPIWEFFNKKNPVMHVLTVKVRNGKLTPLDAANQNLLDEWKKKYANVPAEEFCIIGARP